ncbi:uncharacterized protein LOC109825262 isoform X2 [Asparagus officinalis]|uniref:uncharacterized protein LOC109825262 isoform X2 n=1 Tax=Asparagus officinalis TaxID=4686 RepID=UPI00098E6686|nr:uncharacterized protein LOC109825262 isoform X2 [Asparagus officinalis]
MAKLLFWRGFILGHIILLMIKLLRSAKEAFPHNLTRVTVFLLIWHYIFKFCKHVRTDTAQVEGGVHGLVLYDKTPF